MTEKTWAVAEGGSKKDGRFSMEDIVSMIGANPTMTYRVWKQGLDKWEDPTTLPEYQAIAKAAAPPHPAPVAAAPPPQAAPATPAPQPATDQDESMKKIKEGGKAIFDGAVQQLGKVKDAKDTRSYLPHINMIDKALAMIAGFISQERLDRCDEWAKKGGHLGLIVSTVLIFLFGVILAIMEGPFMATFLKYLIIFPVALILQYLAFKFLDAGKVLIEKSPSRLSSKAFFDCVGLLAFLAALGMLFAGLINAIDAKSLIPLAVGLGGTLILTYSLGVTLNCAVINIHVGDEASAGEEAIGIFSFFMKLCLRLVPFVFGVVNVLGPLLVLFYMGKLILADENQRAFVGVMAEMQFSAIYAIALLPFGMYLLFLVYYLLLDIIRSVLILPEKLDRLRKD